MREETDYGEDVTTNKPQAVFQDIVNNKTLYRIALCVNLCRRSRRIDEPPLVGCTLESMAKRSNKLNRVAFKVVSGIGLFIISLVGANWRVVGMWI